jgi:MFS family permease
MYAGVLGLLVAVALFVLLPKDPPKPAADGGAKGGIAEVLIALKRVFVNPQSWICGLISGLLFIPTTILAMTWGVRFLQEGRGREYDSAVMLAATVPLGWMIGCPLLGFISDRLGRRKPVILAGAIGLLAVLGWVLFGDPAIFRGAPVGILMGIVSGAAMIPYTVVKEVNPPELGGSATGVINFINFTFSALLSPVFGSRLVKLADDSGELSLKDYQSGFQPLLYGVGLAIILTFVLRETGPAGRKA